MSKLRPTVIIFSALFCLSHCLTSSDYIDVTGSVTSFEIKYKNEPDFATIHDQVYAVTIKNQHSTSGYKHQLLLTSIDSGNHQEQRELSCDLSLPTPSSTGISSDKVVVLGNGKLVIATKKESTGDKQWIHLIVIDPFECSTQKAVKVQYDSKYMDVLDLVPYLESFDVFYKYYEFSDSANLPKNPHRYDDQATKIDLSYSLETYPNLYTNFQISPIRAFNDSEGYYHTYFDHGNGDITVLKRLNSQFETVKEVKLKDHSIGISTTQGHINYCLFGNEKSSCKFLNADLEVQVTKELPKLNYPKHRRIETRQVINLPNQGLAVFTAFENSNDAHLCDYYLQPVSSDRSPVKTWKIGTGPLVSYQSHHAYYSYQNYYTYLPSEKDFCYVVFTNNYHENIDMHNRCLDLNLSPRE